MVEARYDLLARRTSEWLLGCGTDTVKLVSEISHRKYIGIAVSVLIATVAVLQAFDSASPALASSATSQVLSACQADGATIETAMSAFVAENPGLVVTATDLISREHGGPYIQDWPNNLEFYQYSITDGRLFVQTAKSASTRVRYTGPASCSKAGIGKVGNWVLINMTRALASCQADGATVSTAMAAFAAQNPGLTVTAADLTSSAHGGPYIESWPHAPHLYSYSVLHGELYVIGANSGSPRVRFTGPSTCREIGL